MTTNKPPRGRTEATKVIQRMLRRVRKNDSDSDYQYVYTDRDGRQISMDGYRMYRLNRPLPLPTLPDGECRLRPALVRLCDEVSSGKQHQLDNIPTVEQLRAFIRSEKEKEKKSPLWHLGRYTTDPYVNAQYLLEFLTVLPNAELYATGNKPKLCPIYGTCAEGDGILMPVRVVGGE